MRKAQIKIKKGKISDGGGGGRKFGKGKLKEKGLRPRHLASSWSTRTEPLTEELRQELRSPKQGAPTPLPRDLVLFSII